MGLSTGLLGCNALAGILEGNELLPPPPPPECTTAAECPVEVPECRTAVACEEGRCVHEDALEGTPLPIQTPGDCAVAVCDGAGKTKLWEAPEDHPDDGDPCTVEACDGLQPTQALEPQIDCYTGPPGTEGVGLCHAGKRACSAEGPVGSCMGEVLPAPETCISPWDEDCDGSSNEEGEACVCEPGTIIPCYTGPLGTEGVGICHGGTKVCDAQGLGLGDCSGEQVPLEESCLDGPIDEDCDGKINESGAGCKCGDGNLSIGEACDDGNLDAGDTCTPLCALPVCGDGWISAGEACDDGDLDPTDECTPKCTVAACGDGFVQPGRGEDCDDGNTMGGDDCPSACFYPIVAVAAGSRHTCAALHDGSVRCWGASDGGQIGLEISFSIGGYPGHMGSNLPAVDLGTTQKVTSLAAGNQHTCALFADGSVKCWGYGVEGQVGLGDLGGLGTYGSNPGEMGTNLPFVDLGPGKKAIAIGAGYRHTCALLEGGAVKCWGSNEYGQLGLGDTLNRGNAPGQMGEYLPPVYLGDGKKAVAISIGAFHTCVLLEGGAVKCWGRNLYGQLGQGDTSLRGNTPYSMGDLLAPIDLGSGKVCTAIAAGGGSTCALLVGGAVKCWGGNYAGQLGLGDTSTRGDWSNEMGDLLPTIDLGTGQKAVALAAGGGHVCAVLAGGGLKCWGDNTFGQLGLGDTQLRGNEPFEMGNSLPEIDAGSVSKVIAISASESHTCAIFADGVMKCWGMNQDGQLGLGDTNHRGDAPGEMGNALPAVSLF